MVGSARLEGCPPDGAPARCGAAGREECRAQQRPWTERGGLLADGARHARRVRLAVERDPEGAQVHDERVAPHPLPGAPAVELELGPALELREVHLEEGARRMPLRIG